MTKSLRQKKQERLKEEQVMLRSRVVTPDLLRREQDFFNSRQSFPTPQAQASHTRKKIIQDQQSEIRLAKSSSQRARDIFLMGFGFKPRVKKRRKR